jgi:transmembrane sensor
MTRAPADRLNSVPAPAEAAAQWLMREKAGPLNESEQAEQAAWLAAHSDNRAAYERACSVWDNVGHVAARGDVRAMRDAALAAKPAPRFRWRYIGLAAAMGAVLIAAGGFTWLRFAPQLTAQFWDAHRYHTAIGERSAVTLQDGSNVVLNTNSAVEVDFASSERRVRLLRGQALFEVAKNPARAFVVLAGNRRITALGTSFDVRIDQDDVRVVLVEGRVAVDALELEPGEQLVARTGAPAVVRAANVARLTSWKAGRLVFQDESLGDAVAEVNRYIRKPLTLDDPQIAALRISGVFRTAEVERFAASMTDLYPLAAMTQPDGSVRLKFREAR